MLAHSVHEVVIIGGRLSLQDVARIEEQYVLRLHELSLCLYEGVGTYERAFARLLVEIIVGEIITMNIGGFKNLETNFARFGRKRGSSQREKEKKKMFHIVSLVMNVLSEKAAENYFLTVYLPFLT